MEIWKIVSLLFLGIGGISGVFVAVIQFSSGIIAERLQQKYQLKMDKELEELKAGLASKNYISKTKFDAEFSIYRNLTEAFSDCVKTISVLIPRGLNRVPYDKEEREKQQNEQYLTARNAYVRAQDELRRNTPFIPKGFYDKYEVILTLCHLQLFDFEERWDVLRKGTTEEKSVLSNETYKRTDTINENFDSLNEEIREYLNELDVL